MPKKESSILNLLIDIYGLENGRATFDRLRVLLQNYPSHSYHPHRTGREGKISQRDAILITYGDQVRAPGIPPLRSLASFCERHIAGVISGIHILPFYPSSSDDGFSVIDYRQVDPALGSWDDIDHLGANFRLMFDAVLNHISSESEWFQGFLKDHSDYRHYFIVPDGDAELSQVVRPRALPLLTTFETPSGPKKVWTTFSSDQIDLNYHNPDVLLEIISTLLFYVAHGAEFIRLDAIAYLWKQTGTTCIHLPQTHLIIQLLRAVLDEVAPHVFLITETNVPHEENISYFGSGSNEAQMVYNFALPPLVLHSLHTGDASRLAKWADGLHLPPGRITFFNFLASHDGIGLNPARNILAPAEIDRLVDNAKAHGGLVSYKRNPDGTQSPYELNINYFDALSDPQVLEALDTQIDRFVAAHAIMFSITGLPGIYFHSLFGSRGWPEGVAQTGRNRTINRQKFLRAELEQQLASQGALRRKVFNRLSGLLRQRAAHPAFHPYGMQTILECNPSVFALLRTSPDDGDWVLCLQNVSSQAQVVSLEKGDLQDLPPLLVDLTSGRQVRLARNWSFHLKPYQTLWLTS